MTRFRAVLLAVTLLLPATTAQADVVLKWNEIAVKTMIQGGQSPFGQARVAAIVQLAVFEAVNAITGDYDPYIGIQAPAGASVDAAAVTAAYKALKALFPNALDIDQAYADSLAAIPNGLAKSTGIDVGTKAAADMIANRANDGSIPALISPVGLPGPGVWQVTLPPGCPAGQHGGSFYQWQNVTPFGVPDVVAFRPDP